MIELIIKQPEAICLDGDVRINGETFRATDISINMHAGELVEVTATFFIDRLNVVAGYEEVKRK